MTFPDNQPLFSMLQPGLQNGVHPWGCEGLSGTPETAEGCDCGQGYRVVSGNLTLQYFEDDHGLQSLTSMTTMTPPSGRGGAPAAARRSLGIRTVRRVQAHRVLYERKGDRLHGA